MPPITPEALERAAVYFAAMLLALTLHEAAHALVATLLGDPTARERGRLSLNPLRHVDPVGTILLPLAGSLTGLPVIGWAKPVPVDLRKVKRPRWDNLWISLAGPGSNLLLCALAVAVARFFQPETGSTATLFLQAAVSVNAFLAFFNLIPLPPLDGAALAVSLLPGTLGLRYERLVAPYGYFILLLLIVGGGLTWLPKVASAYIGLVARALGVGA